MVGQGNLERTWKVREKSRNLKINGYCSGQKPYLFCSKGKYVVVVVVFLFYVNGKHLRSCRDGQLT